MTDLDIKKALALVKKHFPKQIEENRFECDRFEGKRTCIITIQDKKIGLFLHYDIKHLTGLEMAKGIPKLEYQQFVLFPKKLSDVKAILNSLKI